MASKDVELGRKLHAMTYSSNNNEAAIASRKLDALLLKTGLKLQDLEPLYRPGQSQPANAVPRTPPGDYYRPSWRSNWGPSGYSSSSSSYDFTSQDTFYEMLRRMQEQRNAEEAAAKARRSQGSNPDFNPYGKYTNDWYAEELRKQSRGERKKIPTRTSISEIPGGFAIYDGKYIRLEGVVISDVERLVMLNLDGNLVIVPRLRKYLKPAGILVAAKYGRVIARKPLPEMSNPTYVPKPDWYKIADDWLDWLSIQENELVVVSVAEAMLRAAENY